MTSRSTRLKGYRVTRKGSKVILEPIPCYGRDASIGEGRPAKASAANEDHATHERKD